MADPITGLVLGSAALNLAGSLFGGNAERKAARRAAAARRRAAAFERKVRNKEIDRVQGQLEQADLERVTSLLNRAAGLEADDDRTLARSYDRYKQFTGFGHTQNRLDALAKSKAIGNFGHLRSGNAIDTVVGTNARLASERSGQFLTQLQSLQNRGDQLSQTLTQLNMGSAETAWREAGIEADLSFQLAQSRVNEFQGAAGAIRSGIGDYVGLLDYRDTSKLRAAQAGMYNRRFTDRTVGSDG